MGKFTVNPFLCLPNDLFPDYRTKNDQAAWFLWGGSCWQVGSFSNPLGEKEDIWLVGLYLGC